MGRFFLHPLVLTTKSKHQVFPSFESLFGWGAEISFQVFSKWSEDELRRWLRDKGVKPNKEASREELLSEVRKVVESQGR